MGSACLQVHVCRACNIAVQIFWSSMLLMQPCSSTSPATNTRRPTIRWQHCNAAQPALNIADVVWQRLQPIGQCGCRVVPAYCGLTMVRAQQARISLQLYCTLLCQPISTQSGAPPCWSSLRKQCRAAYKQIILAFYGGTPAPDWLELNVAQVVWTGLHPMAERALGWDLPIAAAHQWARWLQEASDML